MKTIRKADSKSTVLRLHDAHARSQADGGLGGSSEGEFIKGLASDLTEARKNPIMVHGFRVQSMFAHVAGAMGCCRLIKEEDAGDAFSSDQNLKIPDFRIVTNDGRQIFVEVKNHHKGLQTAVKFKRSYIDGLKEYAAAFSSELFFAIYWSKMGLWTLVSVQNLRHNAGGAYLPMLDAFKRNEFSLLGDLMLGTVPSLTLKVYADREKPRALNPDGTVQFIIGNAELLSGDEVLTDEFERKVAWFLMNYGKWPATQTPPIVDEGGLVSVGLTVSPEERANPQEEFESIGYLSQMASRQYHDHTIRGGSAVLLRPAIEPGALGVIIPRDYEGKILRLWRFSQRPNIQP